MPPESASAESPRNLDPIRAIRGFEDLLPRQAALHAYVEALARDVFGRYGYQEIRTPVLEPTELFVRSVGDASDVVVQKQMYTFTDPGERSNTLRPEGTAGVVRALIEHAILTQTPLQKLWYSGPMFRYERPQKGRLRQFHQIGVEAFGTATPENDAEIIALSTDLLQKLGFTGLSVKLNTLGDPTDRKKYNAILRERIKRITGQARTTNPGRVGTESASWCDDWDRLADLNPMRVFDTKDPQARPHLQALPRIHDHVGPEARAHHEALCLALDQLGITYEQDADLVRGLDYYSRTVFEVIQGNIGAQSTILGGGRYDGLVAELGGPAVPGVGMAIGLERLILSMEAGGHLPPDDMIMPTPDDIVLCFDTAGLAIGFQLAQEGRRRGRRVLFDALARKPKAALREASRSRARRALILGDGELQRGTVQLKDLESGSQVEVPLSEAFPLS